MNNEQIEFLKLNNNITNKLKCINVNTIGDLWKIKGAFLKENKFSYNEIYQIKVKLQLIGLDLNKKIYNKN